VLRQRVITALVLAPAALAAVLLLPQLYLGLLFWAVIALTAYEWAGLAGLQRRHQRYAYVAAYSMVIGALHVVPHSLLALLWLCAGIWAYAVLAVLVFPRGRTLFGRRAWVGLLGLLLLAGAWVALMVIHAVNDGPFWLIWVFLLVWAADIGGYFAGRGWGRRKLAPAVSPGKTWEGALGGLLLSVCVCAPMGILLGLHGFEWLPLIVLLGVLSIFGDLFESLLKRATGIKDSGTLLPGHGGILDRVDALLAVLPIVALILRTSLAP